MTYRVINAANKLAGKHAVVNVADDSTTITTAAAVVLGVYINTVLSAHILPIEDGAGNAVITLKSAEIAGFYVNLGPHGIIFPNGIVVDPDNAATGNITVIWRPFTPR